jgi:hypothetical protein
MRPSLFWITALSFCNILHAQTRAAAPGTVAGHVYCADTHTPCRFASVTIEAVPQAKGNASDQQKLELRNYAASTDIAGAFQITDVLPGDYYILARMTGYFLPYDLVTNEFPDSSPLRAKAVDAVLPRITVNSGLTTTSVLNLSPGASISGTVRYDDGGVAPILILHLYRKDESGKWQPYLNRSADQTTAPLGMGSHTDSRGHFDELGLPPGIYCVEVRLPEYASFSNTITGRPSVTSIINGGNALLVYNGDKYRLRDATPIELHDGEDRSGTDINIPTQSLRSIHGTIVAKADGHSISTGQISLLDPDDKSLLRKTWVAPDGTFSFNYVLAGSYLLQIQEAADDQDGKTAASYEPMTVPLLVEQDIPNLSYSLSAAKK